VSASSRRIVTVALSAIMILATFVAPAHAITRPEVMKRANHWVKKKVRYSQSSYYQGYRRDCSGFVSMAWKLKTSYTSSSIRSVGKRISVNSLKPGDAVRRTGHVEIFGGWKNKSKRQYWALEESDWGKPALKRVKTFKRGQSALRLPGIADSDPKPAATPVAPTVNPADPTVGMLVPTQSDTASVSPSNPDTGAITPSDLPTATSSASPTTAGAI
jgi:hypothetical protein